MLNNQNIKVKHIINWICVILWTWFLLSFWTALPIPAFFIPNAALTAFLVFFLQMFINIDFKQIICFKNKEFNLLIIITFTTIICLLLSNSRPGAFFTVINFCMLLYLSDKWFWNKFQIITLGIGLFMIQAYWILYPMVDNLAGASNMAGTIVVFSTFSIITVIEYLFKENKKKYLFETVFIILSFCQLFRFKGRGSLIALVFYCVLRFVLPKKWWNKDKLFSACLYIFTIGSVIFAIVYVMIWRKFGNLNNLTFMGKRIFSGREVIWDEFLTLFLNQPLWGTGTNFTPQSYYEFNVHNAMFDILTVHGIVVFTVVTIYIIKKLKKLYLSKKQNLILVPAISGLLAVFCESMTDMDLLWVPQMLVYSFSLVVLNSANEEATHTNN